MKNAQRLSILLICLIFCSLSLCQKKVKPPKYAGYFYVKQLYSGPDAISSLFNSKSRMSLRFFTLNDDLLYYTTTSQTTKIEGSIQLTSILDSKQDNLDIGKCCVNIQKKNFESKDTLRVPSGTGIITLLNANYCIEIKAQDKAYWRLCSDKQNDISQFYMKIIYTVLKTNKKKNKEILKKFFQNGLMSSSPIETHFNWHDQLKWGGNCGSEKYQSPISIKKATPVLKPEILSVDLNFLDVLFSVERKFEEHVVRFMNDAGLLRVSSNNNDLFFKPKHMSFRFPGEHLFEGKRYGGELLLHCDEIHPDAKRRFSNGLIMTIPLEEKMDYTTNKIIESLNVDFWKFEVKENNGKHLPKEWGSNKKLVFSLRNLFDSVLTEKPSYYFYLGSKTTPPCRENVYHLLVDKPIKLSTCQFRLLREHSLQSQKPKEIHSRITQKKNKRKVYSIKNIKLNPAIESYIPKNYLEIVRKLTGKKKIGPKKLSTISTLKSLKFIRKTVKRKKNSKTSRKAKRLTPEKRRKIMKILKNLTPKIRHMLKKYKKIKKYMKYAKYKKYYKPSKGKKGVRKGGKKKGKKGVRKGGKKKGKKGVRKGGKKKGKKGVRKGGKKKGKKGVRKGGKKKGKKGVRKGGKKKGKKGVRKGKNPKDIMRRKKYLKYLKYREMFAKLKKLRGYKKLLKYLKLKKQLDSSVKNGISVKNIIKKIQTPTSDKEEINC